MFKSINLGIKRLIWSIWILVTGIILFFMINNYNTWRESKEYYNEHLNSFDWKAEEERAKNQNDYDLSWFPNLREKERIRMYVFDREKDLDAVFYSFLIFQFGYWGLLFFILWIRQGFIVNNK